MWTYYLRRAARRLKQNPWLTVLMAFALGLGIAATMILATVYKHSASHPIPWKEGRLFAVQLDSWDPNQGWMGEDRPPRELTWRDAQALLKSGIPLRQAAMHKAVFGLELGDGTRPPFLVEARMTGRDFFGLFDVPFAHGGAWEAEADAKAGQVVVLSARLNQKLFGGENGVGRRIKLNEREYTVVGVLAEWEPQPKFYDLENGQFNDSEELYLPLALTPVLQLETAGNTNSWKDEDIASFEDFLNSEQVWLQYWVELPDAGAVDAYQAFIDAYAGEQKKLGRFQRPLNNRLDSVRAWMDVHEVVSEDTTMLLGLAGVFLVVCMLNTMGLLLARNTTAQAEVAVRRALGASRVEILKQQLAESGLVGLLGSALGLVLTALGLTLLPRLGGAFHKLSALDLPLLGLTVALGLAASLLAGWLPAWRVAQVAPAAFLKAQ